MPLKVAEVAYAVITELRPLMPRIKRMDRALADQLLRAANSMVLNLGEAEYSDVGTRRARFFTAAGSANETRTALRLAAAWGYVSAQQIEVALRRLGEVQAMEVDSLTRWPAGCRRRQLGRRAPWRAERCRSSRQVAVRP